MLSFWADQVLTPAEKFMALVTASGWRAGPNGAPLKPRPTNPCRPAPDAPQQNVANLLKTQRRSGRPAIELPSNGLCSELRILRMHTRDFSTRAPLL